MIRPPLTTSMTGPATTPSFSLISSILPQARSYCARFLDRIRRPSLSSFWRTRASTSSPMATTWRGVDLVADRQLAVGDDALGLVADVEQDLVAVDLHHRARDDLAVLDGDHAGRIGVVEGLAAQVVEGDLSGHVLVVAHGCDRSVLRLGLVGSGGGVGHVGYFSMLSRDGGQWARRRRGPEVVRLVGRSPHPESAAACASRHPFPLRVRPASANAREHILACRDRRQTSRALYGGPSHAERHPAAA